MLGIMTLIIAFYTFVKNMDALWSLFANESYATALLRSSGLGWLFGVGIIHFVVAYILEIREGK